MNTLRQHQREWIVQGLRQSSLSRNARWSESLAVGSELFVQDIQAQLGAEAHSRSVQVDRESAWLREPSATYTVDFDGKNSLLSTKP